MRLFSWLLDCRASLAMTGRVQRRPLPVIARRSCAAAIQSSSVRRPEEAAFDQCFGHLFLFRSPCDEAIQFFLCGPWIASLAMTGRVQRGPLPVVARSSRDDAIQASGVAIRYFPRTALRARREVRNSGAVPLFSRHGRAQ